MSAYNISTVRASDKSSIIANGSRPRAFQRAIDKVCTLSLTPPKGCTKGEFVVFVNKIQVNRIKFATKFLCVKTSSSRVVVEPFPKVYKCWV